MSVSVLFVFVTSCFRSFLSLQRQQDPGARYATNGTQRKKERPGRQCKHTHGSAADVCVRVRLRGARYLASRLRLELQFFDRIISV